MNKQLITILLGLLWAGNLLGQVQNEVKKVLSSKDFVALKKYVDNISNRDGISANWDCLRDLTSEFKEGVFTFEYSVPDKRNSSISSAYAFRVTLIATNKAIAFYEISEMKHKKIEYKWEPCYEPIETFKDKKLFDILQYSFQKIFHTNLNLKELFITNFVYGSHCGIVGINPKGRQEIDKWVANGSKPELLNWLKSTNTEKQLYAVDGLLQLKKKGITLTKDEVKIIKFVIGKRGTVNTCNGCLHMTLEISTVTGDFKI